MTDTKQCNALSATDMAVISTGLPDSITLDYLSDFFRVFGDSSRLKLMYYLSKRELCVADLTALAGMQQPSVSHQLKILRLNRLVKYRKVGTTVFYSLDDSHVQSVFEVALEHVNEGNKL